MKRLLGWLCAAFLALIPVLSVLAEEEIPAEPKNSTAVFYLHATSDKEQIKAARYVIFALHARNETDGGDMLISRVDGGGNRRTLYRSSDSNWANKPWAQNQQLFSTGQGNYFGPASTLHEDQLAAVSDFSDIWMIVPPDAYDHLLNNPELLGQMRGMLDSQRQRIHLVLIGDGIPDPTGETALDQLIAAYSGQVEWIRILSDFQAPRTNSTAHTGDFFLASLFGTSDDALFLETPADLVLSGIPSESGENNPESRSFTLPEDGRILILQRYTGTAASLTMTDLQGGRREITKQYALSYLPAGNTESSYTGTLVTQLPAGDYILDGCDDETKVYWYPDPDTLQPAFSMDEEEWKWGDHRVTFALGNTLNRPNDFDVDFTQMNNDQKTIRHTHISYVPESGRWEMNVPVMADSGILKVQITPSARLLMKDGNLIWSWEGEPQIREPKSTPSEAKADAEKDTGTLYFTEQAGGEFRRSWSDFFDYNVNEPYDHDVKRGETVPEDAVQIDQDEDGFTVKALPGNGSGGSGSIALLFGGAEQKLTVTWENAQDIIKADRFDITDDTDTKPVKVGQGVTLTVTIPAKVREAWETAYGQLKDSGFPGIQALTLTGEITKETEATEGTGEKEEKAAEKNQEEQPFAETADGDLSAAVSLPVPVNYPEGSALLNYRVTDTAPLQSSELITGERKLQIQNHAPKSGFTGDMKTELALDGMPDQYEPKDLLEAAFGTRDLFGLFSDEETEAVSEITIIVTNPDGMQVTGELPEETEKDLKIGLKNTKNDLSIFALKPGDHTITLTASDGVNPSEPLSVSVHVYSRILRIAMFAAAGIVLALVILTLILVIRQARKPQFGDIKLRCYVSSDENAERGREIMTKCEPVPMAQFGKKPVSLTDLLILTRQPSLSPETMEAADDIVILPTKHGEVNVLFGKKAMERIGRHEKRDLITQNNVCRMRIDSQYIQIENVQ